MKVEKKKRRVFVAFLPICLLLCLSISEARGGQSDVPVKNHVTDASALFKGRAADLVVGVIPGTFADGSTVKGRPENLGPDINKIKMRDPDGQEYFILVRNSGTPIGERRFLSLRLQAGRIIGRIGDQNSWTEHLLATDGRTLFSYDGSIDDVSMSGELFLVSNFSREKLASAYKVVDGRQNVLARLGDSRANGRFVTESLILIAENPGKVLLADNGKVLREIPHNGFITSCRLPGSKGVVSTTDHELEFEGTRLVAERKATPAGALTMTTAGGVPYRVYKQGEHYGLAGVEGRILTAPIFPGAQAAERAVEQAGAVAVLKPPFFTEQPAGFRQADGTLTANRIDGFEVTGAGFSEGLAPVGYMAARPDATTTAKSSAVYHVGYVDENLDWVIPVGAGDATAFKNGIAWVLLEGNWLSIRNPLSAESPRRAAERKKTEKAAPPAAVQAKAAAQPVEPAPQSVEPQAIEPAPQQAEITPKQTQPQAAEATPQPTARPAEAAASEAPTPQRTEPEPQAAVTPAQADTRTEPTPPPAELPTTDPEPPAPAELASPPAQAMPQAPDEPAQQATSEAPAAQAEKNVLQTAADLVQAAKPEELAPQKVDPASQQVEPESQPAKPEARPAEATPAQADTRTEINPEPQSAASAPPAESQTTGLEPQSAVEATPQPAEIASPQPDEPAPQPAQSGTQTTEAASTQPDTLTAETASQPSAGSAQPDKPQSPAEPSQPGKTQPAAEPARSAPVESVQPSTPQPAAEPSRDKAPARVGPSFDCSRAGSAVAKAICADPELSALDLELAAAYKQALAASTNKSAVRTGQRKWVQERDKTCGRLAAPNLCIENNTKERLSQLRPENSKADK